MRIKYSFRMITFLTKTQIQKRGTYKNDKELLPWDSYGAVPDESIICYFHMMPFFN